MTSRNNRRSTNTTASIGSGASFATDEDGSEMGHLSVSVSELNQLRQHVRSMRKNISGKNNLAPAGDISVATNTLEEVDLATGWCSNKQAPAGLVVSEDLTQEEKTRRFRLSIVGNIMFVLGAILYVCVAHGDLQWAKDIQGIPVTVLEADDDATWSDWEQQQQTAGATRRRMQEHRSLQSFREIGDDDTGLNYNRMQWKELPVDIQLALMVLGHNQHTWNNAMTSQIEELPWAQLTNEQRDAAQVIGYTAQEWDEAEEEQQKMWEATQQAYFTTTDGGDDRYNEDDRYQDVGDDRYEDEGDDDEEPEDDRYEPEDDRYDPEDDRYEDENEDDEYEADDQEPMDDRYEDEQEDDQYADDEPVDDEVDDEFPDDDKTVTAGEVFDWYKESAGDDYYPEDVGTGGATVPDRTSPPTTTAPTTVAPTTAAQYTIDGAVIPTKTSPSDPVRQPLITPAPGVPTDVQGPDELMIWGDYEWEGLPDQVKKAFEILGYNEELWNTGGVAFTEDLYWSDLTSDQQRQAMVLGYNQALWDQAEDENYDIVSGEQGDDAVDDDYEYDGDDDAEDYDVQEMFDEDVETNAVMLFFASLCFMIAGIMNWIRERQVFHMWMVQGGVFGILSALTMGFSDFASLLLQTVSVHCFLLQSFFMLRLRKTIRPVEGIERISIALWGADILFAAGSFIQVVLVYVLHADDDAYYSVGLATGDAFAAYCWLFTAGVYTMNTMASANKTIEEDSATRTLTIQRKHPNGETYTIRPAAIQLRERPPIHDVVIT